MVLGNMRHALPSNGKCAAAVAMLHAHIEMWADTYVDDPMAYRIMSIISMWKGLM